MSIDDLISAKRTIYYANGPAIRKAREAAWFGLREAARKLGISSTYLSRLELHTHHAVDFEVLTKMRDLFNIKS